MGCQTVGLVEIAGLQITSIVDGTTLVNITSSSVILIDGQNLGAGPWSLAVGSHTILVSKSGYITHTETITLTSSGLTIPAIYLYTPAASLVVSEPTLKIPDSNGTIVQSLVPGGTFAAIVTITNPTAYTLSTYTVKVTVGTVEKTFMQGTIQSLIGTSTVTLSGLTVPSNLTGSVQLCITTY